MDIADIGGYNDSRMPFTFLFLIHMLLSADGED